MITAILITLWYITGVFSFIYWWTKDFDLTSSSEDIVTCLACGLIGPITWFIGWTVHGKTHREPKILFKKRKSKTTTNAHRPTE